MYTFLGKAVMLCCLLLSVVSLSGQHTKIAVTGNIIDESNSPVVGATVVLLRAQDSIMQSFTTTDASGNFALPKAKKGSAILQISYIGYGTFEKKLELDGSLATVTTGEIQLLPQSGMLGEITIKADIIPIKVKKDTVEYNADAFRVTPNANVEELLKKLPGVEVDNDGTITAQGEKVVNVTVDGKKFFGDDPKMATQNLPANAVKKVQIFDKKSEKAEFTGVNDGETEKTINLELKDDKKIGTFGTIQAGYGTNDRFETKLNLNKFTSKFQLATIIGYNNVNQQGFSFSEYNSLLGNSSNNRGGANFNDISGGTGLAKSLNGGINLSYLVSKKLKFTTSYFVSNINKDLVVNTNRDNALSASNTYSESEYNRGDNNNTNHTFNFITQINPDSVQRIDLDLGYKVNNYDNVSTLLNTATNSNNVVITNTNQQDLVLANNKALSAELKYNLKLNNIGRLLTLEGSYGKTKVDDDKNVDRTVDNQLNPQDSLFGDLLQHQIGLQDNKNYRILGEWREPLAKRTYVNGSYSLSNYAYLLNKDFYDLDPADQTIATLNTLLSSATNNDINYQRMGLGLTKDNEKYTLNANVAYQLSDLSDNIQNLSYKYGYLLPSLNLNLVEKNIRFRYNTSVNLPSINQLQTIPDNSSVRNFYYGNPNLLPSYTHTFNARYSFFDNFNFKNLFTFINYSYTTNDIINSKTIDSNLNSITTPINAPSRSRINGVLHYGQPFKPLQLKARFRVGYSWTRSYAAINDVNNIFNSYGPNGSIELENINNKYFTLVVNGGWRWSKNVYSQNTQNNAQYLNSNYGANLIVELGKGFQLDTKIDYYIYSQEQFAGNNTYTLWNAGIGKNLMDNRLNVKIKMFDILNQNKNISRSAGDTYVEEVITNTLSQYGMLHLTYKLSALTPDNNNGPRMPFMR